MDANAICTAQELAGVLGVSDRRVRQLVQEGVLKCARTKRGGMHFRLGDSVQRFIEHRCAITEEQFEAVNGEYEQARTRRMNAIAEQSELELQARKGKLHRQDDLDYLVALRLRNFRDRCLAIPSRVMHILQGKTAKEINKIVSTEVCLALNELADFWGGEHKEERDRYLESKSVDLSALNGEG